MGTAEMAKLESNYPKWKLLSATTIKLIAVIRSRLKYDVL